MPKVIMAGGPAGPLFVDQIHWDDISTETEVRHLSEEMTEEKANYYLENFAWASRFVEQMKEEAPAAAKPAAAKKKPATKKTEPAADVKSAADQIKDFL